MEYNVRIIVNIRRSDFFLKKTSNVPSWYKRHNCIFYNCGHIMREYWIPHKTAHLKRPRESHIKSILRQGFREFQIMKLSHLKYCEPSPNIYEPSTKVHGKKSTLVLCWQHDLMAGQHRSWPKLVQVMTLIWWHQTIVETDVNSSSGRPNFIHHGMMLIWILNKKFRACEWSLPIWDHSRVTRRDNELFCSLISTST